MNRQRLHAFFTCIALIAIGLSSASAEEAKMDGAALYAAKGCQACHGLDGNKAILPTYPNLVGLPVQYAVNQIKDIKSGARSNGQSAAMKGIVAGLSEEGMTKIAKWLAGSVGAAKAAAPEAKKSEPAPKAVANAEPAPASGSDGAALYAAKGCQACHGPDGLKVIMPVYPKVAGLPAEYSLNQMKDFKSGARSNGKSAVMKGIVMTIDDKDLKTIAEWLAGNGGTVKAAAPDTKKAEPAPKAAAPAPKPEPAPAAKAEPAPVPTAKVAAAPAAAPASGSDGAQLYMTKTCLACHGADGRSPVLPNYPKIAGQNAGYLYNQLRDTKNGSRNNGQSAVMKGILANVSDEEIRAIADWLTTQ